jgi:hypothetical protein
MEETVSLFRTQLTQVHGQDKKDGDIPSTEKVYLNIRSRKRIFKTFGHHLRILSIFCSVARPAP